MAKKEQVATDMPAVGASGATGIRPGGYLAQLLHGGTEDVGWKIRSAEGYPVARSREAVREGKRLSRRVLASLSGPPDPLCPRCREQAVPDPENAARMVCGCNGGWRERGYHSSLFPTATFPC